MGDVDTLVCAAVGGIPNVCWWCTECMKGLGALRRVKARSGSRENPEKAPDGKIHAEMKMYWQAFSNTPYNEDVLKRLSHVLFMK